METHELNKKLKLAVADCLEKTITEGIEYSNKKYLPVKTRLEILRNHFGVELGVVTHMELVESWGQPHSLCSAAIMCGTFVIASGHGMVINNGATAPVEKAETIAIGRALACLGLIGEEYASANEMERVVPASQDAVRARNEDSGSSGSSARSLQSRQAEQAEKARPVPDGADDLRDKYNGMPPKEREFRKAVDESFPPTVSRYTYKMPSNNAPDQVDLVFSEIDRIEDVNELRAYFDALRNDDFSAWVEPQDWAEVKATFASRDRQLNGDR